MERKLFGLLSGAQVTAIVCTAIVAPSAAYATLEFVNVSLVNPNSGVAAAIDSGQRLWVYDTVAGYRNNPANAVDIKMQANGNQCETAEQYPIPSGKAFVITAVSGFVTYPGYGNNSGFTIFAGASCTGNPLANSLSVPTASAPYIPLAVDYGSGIPVPAGSTLSVFSANNTGFTYIHGYLVPSTAIPATGTFYGK